MIKKILVLIILALCSMTNNATELINEKEEKIAELLQTYEQEIENVKIRKEKIKLMKEDLINQIENLNKSINKKELKKRPKNLVIDKIDKNINEINKIKEVIYFDTLSYDRKELNHKDIIKNDNRRSYKIINIITNDNYTIPVVSIKVVSGDTLNKLINKINGTKETKWKLIKNKIKVTEEFNPQLKKDKIIDVGQILRIPFFVN